MTSSFRAGNRNYLPTAKGDASDKCGISPMNIVNIKRGSHTYSQQLVENLERGLELNDDEMHGFMGAPGF